MPDSNIDAARAILRSYHPWCAEQAATRDRILAFIDAHPTDAHRRTCLEGHLTAGALLVDSTMTRVLLTHHKKLDKWLQFGGHCDGDADLRAVALRELHEESGIEPAWLSAEPIDVDVHSIPARGREPEHLHLDVRYLAIAPPGAREICSAESHELEWFDAQGLAQLDLGDSVARLCDLAFTQRH